MGVGIYMSYKKKGMKVAKVALATTMATSVVAITNPADADSQKEAEKLVKQAEKLATNLQKEVTYESRVKLHPKDKLGLPNMKLYKNTGVALKKAQKEVNKLKGNEKKKLQTRLASKVQKPYNYAKTYINVVTSAKGLDKTNETLNQYLSKGKIYPSVIKLHAAFNKDVKDFTQSISKVSGTKTKQALRDTYVKKFNKTDKSVSYAITIKNELAQLNKYVNAGEIEKAKKLQKTVQSRLATGKKLGYITNALAKSYGSSLVKASQAIDKRYTYTAESGNLANPTLYGGTTDEAKVINHDLVVVAGKSQYIKVANIEVNGNVVIKGDETGAGTVTFDHVKVNAVNGKGGEIIVEDVADHSFYITNVTADKLSIKDINGGNIVAQEGTKIQELAVVDKAGETGKINLVSTKGSFEQVNVASTGGKTDVAFNGDFSESKIEIKAPAAQVTIAKDAVIKEMDIKSEAKINAQEGAKVESINLAVEQKGQKVEFSGSLKDAKVNITNSNVAVEVAKDTVIKEIAKEKDVTGDVAITNNGKIDTVTDVKVETPSPAPTPSLNPSSSTSPDPTPTPSPKTAATLTATAAPGKTANTTAVTATTTTDHSLVYKVSSTTISTPNVGDSVTGTQTLTSGADISGVDSTTHKYLGVYELDGSNKVVKFSLITLQASDIKVAESSVAVKSVPTIMTSEDGKKVTFSVEIDYVNNYETGTVTAEVGNKNGAGLGIDSQVVNNTTGTVTLTKEFVIADLAQYKDANDKVYISIGIKEENNYHGTWKTIETSSFEVPVTDNDPIVSDIVDLTIGVDNLGAITGNAAKSGGTLKYLLANTSKANQISAWNVDTTEAEANTALGGTLGTTKPTITDVDNEKFLVVAEIKDGKVVAAGQSSDIHVSPLETDSTPPAFDMPNFGVVNATDTTLDLKVKVDEDATGYYVLVPYSEGNPFLAQVKQGNNILGIPAFNHGSFALSANTQQTVKISELVANTQYKLVMFVEDTHGNTTDLQVFTPTTLEDQTAPNTDQQAADAVTAKITALPAEITLVNETAVSEAKVAFDGLTATQQVLVSEENQTKLTEAVAKIAELLDQTVPTFYTLNFSVVGDNGTLEAKEYGENINTGAQIKAGNNYVNFIANPNEGYRVKKWTFNGVESSNKLNTYSISNPSGLWKNITISVEFEKNQTEVTVPTVTLVSNMPERVSYDKTVPARSSITGALYLVPNTANPTSKSDLDALIEVGQAQKVEITQANYDVEIPTTGLSIGKYKVYAVSSEGTLSLPSESIDYVPKGVVYGSGTSQNNTAGEVQNTLTWTIDSSIGLDHYSILRRESLGEGDNGIDPTGATTIASNLTVDTETFTDVDVEPGKTYFYYVVSHSASNVNNESVGKAKNPGVKIVTEGDQTVPSVGDVTIDGIDKISSEAIAGSTLTASYSYSGAADDSKGQTKFQWFRADDSNGTNKTAISGATSNTYQPTSADVRKYISVEVTPVAATGTAQGSAVSSAFVEVTFAMDLELNVSRGPKVINAILGSGNHLAYIVKTSETEFNVGSSLSVGATDNYTVGERMTGVDSTTNKYLYLFECDSNNKIVYVWHFNLGDQTPSITDRQLADAVTAKIGVIPAVEQLTLTNEQAVNEAKTAFENLTETQKGWVSVENQTKLTEAINKMSELRNQRPLDVTPPTIDMSHFGVENITNYSVNLNVKVDENATGYYVLIPYNAETPSLEQVRQGRNASNQLAFPNGNIVLSANLPKTVTINGLAVAMQYKLVMFVEDVHGNVTELIELPVTPTLPAPMVTADDINNVIVDARDGMEYSIDGGQTWVKYEDTNPPTFEGYQTVAVRLDEDGEVTYVHFTKNPSALRIIAFKEDYNLNEPFDYDFLQFVNAKGEEINVDKEDIKIEGFDSSKYEESQQVKVTVNGISETKSVDILPAGPNKLIADDNLDKLFGLDNTMEYQLANTEEWIKFTGENVPDLSGRKDISVRYSDTSVLPHSQEEHFIFTNGYLFLDNNAKIGIPTDKLTYGWYIGHLDDVTFTSLQNKGIGELFDSEQDILNVFGDTDVKITNVTWDNSGDQLKSTFTLAQPINMKDTLGISFRLKGMQELDNWVGFNYIALYKASTDELVDLLLKEVSSNEKQSRSNIEEILEYMSAEEIHGASKEKIINNYIPSFNDQYIKELELSASNIKSISNLQDVINKVNEEQFIKESPTIQEEVKNIKELLTFSSNHKTEVNQETFDSFADLVPAIEVLVADFDITDETKNMEQLVKTYIQLEESLNNASQLKWDLIFDLREIEEVTQIQQEIDNFYTNDSDGFPILKDDVTQGMVANVENKINTLPKDLQGASNLDNAVMRLKEDLAQRSTDHLGNN